MEIHVAVVSCGSDRLPETLALLRSILLTTNHRNRLQFHLVHQHGDTNDQVIDNTLNSWKQTQTDFDFAIYSSHFPLTVYETLFAPCACQRLFLHHVLPENVDRVIYIDTDTLLLSDISHMWRLLDDDSGKVAAMAAEDEGTKENHYYTNARVEFPFVEMKGRAYGLNSGVMLLNLKQLRQDPWDEELDSFLARYQLTFYDQDLLNIYFAMHPERLLLLPCEWNFRPDHCYFSQHCSGIRLLHGNRRVFHKQATTNFPVLAFQILFESFAPNSYAEPLGTCHDVRSRLHALIQEKEGQQYDNQCEIVVLSVALYQIPEACRLARQDLAPSFNQEEL
jgi:UDP-xylose:glucoside alpha-1,3-xylosyltransferase